MCMLPRGRVLVREFHEAPRGKILHSTRLLLLITGRDEAKREKYKKDKDYLNGPRLSF